MTPIEEAASALMADLHNGGLMRCPANHVEQAAHVIKAALEAVAAAEREACAKIAADIAAAYNLRAEMAEQREKFIEDLGGLACRSIAAAIRARREGT